jgi:hypothetical protein
MRHYPAAALCGRRGIPRDSRGALEVRDGQDALVAECLRFLRSIVEHRGRVRQAVRRSVGAALFLVALVVAPAQAQEPELATFRTMFYGEPGAKPELLWSEATITLDTSPMPWEPPERPLFKHAAVMYLPGAVLDALSTEYFLSWGGHELNFMFRERWVRWSCKVMVEPMAAAVLERWLERHLGRGASRVFRGVMWGSRFIVALHNMRLGNRLRTAQSAAS